MTRASPPWPPRCDALLVAVVVVAAAGAPAAHADPVYFGTAARGGIDPAAVQRLRTSIEKALTQQGVAVLTLSGAAQESAAQKEEQARRLLDEGTAAYGEQEWVASLDAATKAFRMWEQGPAYTDSEEAWELFRDIQSLRALVFFKLNRKRDADEIVRSILVAMPGWTPNRDKAPPELIDSYDLMLDDIRATPPAQLEVLSKPTGAKVVVDGKVRGRAPLLLEDVQPGIHYVLLEGPGGRHTERAIVDEVGGRVSAKLGSKKSAAAKDIVKLLDKPVTAQAFVEAISDVGDEGMIAVLLPYGKRVDIVGARVAGGEVKVVCAVRTAVDNDNDRDRAVYVLVEGLRERSRDAWLDKQEKEAAVGLRQMFFSGLGTLEEEEPPVEVPPAVIAVSVIGTVLVLAVGGSTVGILVARELKKSEGFTWSVDTSDLRE